MTPKYRIRKVEMVNVADIKAAPFNPPDRTEKANLETLKAAILQANEIISPIIVSRDLHLIDGHRRLAVARELGWTAVPCIIVEYGLQEGWALLNGATRPIGAKGWTAAAAYGMDTRYMPKEQARRIERIRQIAGDEGLTILADKRMSNWFIQQVNSVARAIGDMSEEYMKTIMLWLINHKQQYPARRAIELGMLEELAYAIAEDKPLPSLGTALANSPITNGEVAVAAN